MFTPILGEDDENFTCAYFSGGLVQPPTGQMLLVQSLGRRYPKLFSHQVSDFFGEFGVVEVGVSSRGSREGWPPQHKGWWKEMVPSSSKQMNQQQESDNVLKMNLVLNCTDEFCWTLDVVFLQCLKAELVKSAVLMTVNHVMVVVLQVVLLNLLNITIYWLLKDATVENIFFQIILENKANEQQKRVTPWKFNIAPENIPFQKESGLPTIIFQGLC